MVAGRPSLEAGDDGVVKVPDVERWHADRIA